MAKRIIDAIDLEAERQAAAIDRGFKAGYFRRSFKSRSTAKNHNGTEARPVAGSGSDNYWTMRLQRVG